jgi:four helix bundle protein
MLNEALKTTNLIQQRSFDFAKQIIGLYSELQHEKEFVLSRQLLKSGTSIGANVEEAIGGQSRKDFASKMAIASKEARETKYWLRLLMETDLSTIDVTKYLEEVDAIINILTKIVKTTQSHIQDPLKD